VTLSNSAVFTPAMSVAAREIASWTRWIAFLGLVSGVGGFLTVTGAAAFVGRSSSIPLPLIIIVGSVYAAGAILSVAMAFLLLRMSQALRHTDTSVRSMPMANALAYEHGYWLFAAIVCGIWIVGTVLSAGTLFLRSTGDAQRVKRTSASIVMIGAALEAYASEHHGYPDVKNISQLRSELQPKFLERMPEQDAWQQELLYEVECTQGHCFRYWLASPGADGQYEKPPRSYSERWRPPQLKELSPISSSRDFIHVNGRLVEGPPGVFDP
jgi:hypothetical protein